MSSTTQLLDELLLLDEASISGNKYEADGDLALLDDLTQVDADDMLILPTHCEEFDLAETLIATTHVISSDEAERNCSTPSSTAGETQLQQKAVRPGRKRRKDELEYLRNKVHELEYQLEQLKKRNADEDNDSYSSPLSASSTCSGSDDQHIADLKNPPHAEATRLIWKRVARNQREGKKMAEKENLKLRETIESQLVIIKELEKALRKRTALQADTSWIDDRKRVRVENESESAIFAMLFAGLDEQHLLSDLIFRENGFAASKTELQNAQVKIDMTTDMYMEFLDSKIVPFALADTQDAVWRCLAQREMKLQDGYYGVVDASKDTMSAKMVKTLRNQHLEARIDAKFVVKRYKDRNNIVFVWACQTDTEGAVSKTKGVKWFDRGWTIVESLSCNDDANIGDGTSSPSTIVQSCARVRPHFPDSQMLSQQDVTLLTDLATGSFLQNLSYIHQAVEDLLMKEALK